MGWQSLIRHQTTAAHVLFGDGDGTAIHNPLGATRCPASRPLVLHSPVPGTLGACCPAAPRCRWP